MKISGSNGTDQPTNYGSQNVTVATNNPGSRTGTISWMDSNNIFWLFGGHNTDWGMNFFLVKIF